MAFILRILDEVWSLIHADVAGNAGCIYVPLARSVFRLLVLGICQNVNLYLTLPRLNLSLDVCELEHLALAFARGYHGEYLLVCRNHHFEKTRMVVAQ